MLLISCATATGPLFEHAQAVDQHALIYVYRKDLGHWQSAYSPTFLMDNKEIASIPREGYLALNVASGEHTFGFEHNFLAGYKPVNIPLKVLPNQIYYLKISDPISFDSASQPGALYGTNTSLIAIIDEEVALKELSTTHLVAPNSKTK